MGEVKRWNRGGRLFRGAMVEVGDGDWVEYSDYATLEARSEALEKERDALRAEVARLSAACGQMRAALEGCAGGLKDAIDRRCCPDDESGRALLLAREPLSDDAGKGWIDATGAVEATVGDTYDGTVVAGVPDDWAGKRVLVALKP